MRWDRRIDRQIEREMRWRRIRWRLASALVIVAGTAPFWLLVWWLLRRRH